MDSKKKRIIQSRGIYIYGEESVWNQWTKTWSESKVRV